MSIYRGRFWAAISSLMLVAANQSTAAAGEDDLLLLVRNSHRAATESIRTFSCKVALTYDPLPPPPLGNETAQYWRSGNDFRCLVRRSTTMSDTLYKNGVVKSYSADSQHIGDRGRNGRITTRDMAFNCSPWTYGLLTFLGRDRFRVSLDELLTQDHRVHAVERMARDGRELIRLDISHDRGRIEIWFDPSVNYLARFVKLRTEPPNGKSETEAEVKSYLEVSPGIFFPTNVYSYSLSGEEKRRQEWTATFSDIKINKPLPAEALTVRFPPGLLVSDGLRNDMFRTDNSGEPVLPATNSQGKRLTFSDKAPVPTAQPDNPSDSVTREEPRPSFRWVLPVSVGLLCVSAVLWGIKRWRGSRDQSSR